jgi:hypothetical protein
MTLQIYKNNTSKKDFVISTDNTDRCYILHKEYNNNYDNNNDNYDYHILNNNVNDTEITDNIILSKNGICGFNKDDNKIYKCPPEQCCSNNMCTVDLEQCKTINFNGFETIQKYIENKTILNHTDNKKDNTDNIYNIDNIDHSDNIIFYINNDSDILQLKINELKNIKNKFFNIIIKKSNKNYAIRQSKNKIYNNNEIYELINELLVFKTNNNDDTMPKYNSPFYFIIILFCFYVFFIKKSSLSKAFGAFLAF